MIFQRRAAEVEMRGNMSVVECGIVTRRREAVLRLHGAAIVLPKRLHVRQRTLQIISREKSTRATR